MRDSRVPTGRVLLLTALLISVVLLWSANLLAQDQLDETPKHEVFLGYSWLHPGATIPIPGFPPTAPAGQTLGDQNAGGIGSYTYNFYKHLGLEGEFARNTDGHTSEQTLSAGPRVEARSEGFVPFAHALLSWNRLEPQGLGSRDGIGAVLGAGFILQATKLLGIHFGADYVYGRQNFADVVSASFPDLRRVSLGGARLTVGPVFNFGYPATATPSSSCSAQPTEVMVGEPVTVTATPSNFKAKHTLKYDWNSTGGKITGKDNTASIDTNGIAGGNYTATAHITDPKKKGAEASCTANFTVKEPPKNPPTMSCSASPTTVQAGGSATITCSCTSPDNVPVNVSNWTASGGTISGTGNTGTLNTTGAQPGTITASATCTDSRGLTGQGSTQVTVEAPPPPPPPPQASKLSSCDFGNMAKIGKPWRVDNECKGILDDVAKNLQQNADNKLVVVGNAAANEKRRNLAAERAVDAKAYLTGGEAKLGIDPSRIETRTGSAGTQTDEFWIVPAGATFSGEGTQAVDETKVKAVPDHPRAPAKKKAATAAPPKQ